MDFEDNNPFSASANDDMNFAGIEELQRPQLTAPLPESGKITAYKLDIIDAGKSREGSQRGHIVYTIRLTSGVIVRRRYSEFETFRRCLRRLYPTVVVPPIPEKHSLSAYATNPTHAHEDAKVIDHRRRMLGAFLNRCLETPPLRTSWLLERFLDPNTSWSEVLMSDQVLSLPKSPLQAPPLDSSQPTPAHAFLPIPPSSARLRSGSEASEFKDAEASAKEYEAVIGGGLDKCAHRITKQYSQLAADCADLGGQFNAFSLDCQGPLMTAIEKIGQAVDTEYLTTESLVDRLSVEFTEPLGESVQLAATARQVLKYRRYRALQVDMTADQLAAKKSALVELERAESEAQRISSILHADERIAAAQLDMGLPLPNSDETTSEGETQHASKPLAQEDIISEDEPQGGQREHKHEQERKRDREYDHGQDHDQDQEIPEETDRTSLISIEALDEGATVVSSGAPSTSATTASASMSSVVPSRRFRLPGFSQLSHTIHGMMDVDPEAARRANITRTQEQIANLEAALQVAREDSVVATTAVRDEIERYRTAKEDDLRCIVKAFVRCHIEWAEKNLEQWMDARQAVLDKPV